jgi:hypothetical protein
MNHQSTDHARHGHATTWNVTFIGDYATVTTTVEALDENDAETLAANLIMDYYDFDVADMANDVVAEQLDEDEIAMAMSDARELPC